MAKNKIAPMSKEEAAELSRILTIYRSYWSSVHNRMRLFEELYAIYRFYRDPFSHSYKYNVSKPIALTYVQQYIANMINTVFDRDKIINMTPVNVKGNRSIGVVDMAELSRQLERCVNGLWNLPDTKFFLNAYDWFFDQSTYGVSFISTLPRFKDTIGSDGKPTRRYVGPAFKAHDVFNVIPNPWMETIDGGDLFLKEVVSFQELKRREKVEGYKNVDAVKEYNYIPEDLRRELLQDTGILNMIDYAHDQMKKHNKILLLHYFENGHISTIAGNSVFVKTSKSPRKARDPLGNPIFNEDGTPREEIIKPYPYDLWDSLSMNAPSREIYGIGIAELAKQFQENANLRASQRFENIELAIQKVLLVNTLFDIDPDNLIFGAGNIITTNDINNSVKVFEMGNVTQDWYTEDALEQSQVEQAGGTMPINRGQLPGGRPTASGIITASRSGVGRQSMNLKRVDVLFRSLAIKTLIQVKEFWTKEEYESFIGDEDAGLYNMTIDDLQHSINIRISASSLDLTRDQTNQQLLQLYPAALNQPYVNGQELTREMFRRLVSDVNPDKFIQELAPPAPTPASNGGQPGAQNTPGNPAGNQQTEGLGLGNLTPDMILDMVEGGEQ